MTAGERSKLVGILWRMSSEFPGERAAAALLASNMVKKLGMTWDDLIVGDGAANTAPPGADLVTRRRIAAVLRDSTQLNAREVQFLRSVLHSRRRPTPKQRAWLADILARAGGAERSAA